MDVGMSVSAVCVRMILIGYVQKRFNRSVLYCRLEQAADTNFLHKATTIDLLRPNGDVSCASWTASFHFARCVCNVKKWAQFYWKWIKIAVEHANEHTHIHTQPNPRTMYTCNIIHTDNRIDDDNIDFHQTAEPVKRNMYLYLYLYLYLYGVREVLYIANGKAYTLSLTHCKRVNNTVESTRSIQQWIWIYLSINTHPSPARKWYEIFFNQTVDAYFLFHSSLLTMNNLLTMFKAPKRSKENRVIFNLNQSETDRSITLAVRVKIQF